MNKETYHHGNLREALVEQAQSMIAEDSFDALSLRKLARELDVNQTALYSHFKNKNALLAELALRGFRQLIQQSHIVMSEGHSPEQTLSLFAEYYLDFARQYPELFKLMFGPLFSELHPESESLWTTAEESFALFQNVIGDYLASIHSKTPNKLAILTVWSFMHGFVHLVIGDRLGEDSLSALDSDGLLEQLLGVIKNGLKSP